MKSVGCRRQLCYNDSDFWTAPPQSTVVCSIASQLRFAKPPASWGSRHRLSPWRFVVDLAVQTSSLLAGVWSRAATVRLGFEIAYLRACVHSFLVQPIGGLSSNGFTLHLIK